MAQPKHMKKPRKRLSKLSGSSSYANNCSDGCATVSKKQAHHILSLTCLGKRKKDYPGDAARKKYIEDCLYCTEWDINKSPNLIWLPLNKQYRNSKGKVPTDLPSHQVDHNTANGYTKEVSAWLKANIWDKITKKDDIHKADVRKVKRELENGSAHWNGKLKRFGRRNSGTEWSWENRHEKDQKKK